MNAVAPPARWADATNSNAARALTLAAAGYPAGGWLVTVDTTHHGTLHSSKNGSWASAFQQRFWLGRVRSSDRERGMRKSDFLEFLAQLQVYRHIDGAGDGAIQHAVVVAAFETWEKSRSLGPIADWERVQAFLHEVPGQVYDDAFLDWAQDVVENRGWWRSDDFHERWEVENFRKLLAKYRRLNAERKAVRLRRADAGHALKDPELRSRVFERDGYRCRSCQSAELLAVDHVVAVINGGTDDFDNLQTLCRACNSSKGRKDAAAWRRRGKLS